MKSLNVILLCLTLSTTILSQLVLPGMPLPGSSGKPKKCSDLKLMDYTKFDQADNYKLCGCHKWKGKVQITQNDKEQCQIGYNTSAACTELDRRNLCKKIRAQKCPKGQKKNDKKKCEDPSKPKPKPKPTPKKPKCKDGLKMVKGKCVSPCGKNQKRVGSGCVKKCKKGEILKNGKCVTPKPSCMNKRECQMYWVGIIKKKNQLINQVKEDIRKRQTSLGRRTQAVVKKPTSKDSKTKTLKKLNNRLASLQTEVKNAQTEIKKCKDQTCPNGFVCNKKKECDKLECKAPEVMKNGKCVKPTPECKKPNVLKNGKCVKPAPECKDGLKMIDGKCQSPCEKDEVRASNGGCVKKCDPPKYVLNGKCKTPNPNCMSKRECQMFWVKIIKKLNKALNVVKEDIRRRQMALGNRVLQAVVAKPTKPAKKPTKKAVTLKDLMNKQAELETQMTNSKIAIKKCKDQTCANGFVCNKKKECEKEKCKPSQVVNPKTKKCEDKCNATENYNPKTKKCEDKCPANQKPVGDKCVDRCKDSQKWTGKECSDKCGPGQTWKNGKCEDLCDSDEEWNAKTQKCEDICPKPETKYNPKTKKCDDRCKVSQTWKFNKCVDKCDYGKTWNPKTGKCESKCKEHEKYVKGKCVSRCKAEEKWNAKEHRCDKICKSGTKMVNGKCVSKCKNGEVWKNGVCQGNCPNGSKWDAKKHACIGECAKGEMMVNGICKKSCKPGEFLDKDGNCMTSIRLFAPMQNFWRQNREREDTELMQAEFKRTAVFFGNRVDARVHKELRLAQAYLARLKHAHARASTTHSRGERISNLWDAITPREKRKLVRRLQAVHKPVVKHLKAEAKKDAKNAPKPPKLDGLPDFGDDKALFGAIAKEFKDPAPMVQIEKPLKAYDQELETRTQQFSDIVERIRKAYDAAKINNDKAKKLLEAETLSQKSAMGAQVILGEQQTMTAGIRKDKVDNFPPLPKEAYTVKAGL